MPNVVENPQVIGLMKIFHDDIKVISVFFFNFFHRKLNGDKLVNTFAAVFLQKQECVKDS